MAGGFGQPYQFDVNNQPLGTITATPARVLRKKAIKVLRTRGVVAKGRRR